MDMAVHADGVDAETEVQREVGRLDPDAREFHQKLCIGRHLSIVLIDECLRDLPDLLRLAPVESCREYELRDFISGKVQHVACGRCPGKEALGGMQRDIVLRPEGDHRGDQYRKGILPAYGDEGYGGKDLAHVGEDLSEFREYPVEVLFVHGDVISSHRHTAAILPCGNPWTLRR